MYYYIQAEELIKKEMLQMLRHDLVHHPPATANNRKKTAHLTAVKGELEKSPLDIFDEEELQQVKQILFVSVV